MTVAVRRSALLKMAIREECIREFLAAQASGCAHATLHALSRLARPGGFDWVNTNLTEIGLRSEAPLEFAVVRTMHRSAPPLIVMRGLVGPC